MNRHARQRPIPRSDQRGPASGPDGRPGPLRRAPMAVTMPSLAPDSARQSLARMRLIATALLVLMALVLAGALQFEGTHPAWGYVIAFSEAAMVGGLADWFAVTALFRHPLGIPIPHTAI